MTLVNVINLLKTASGLILNQKNVAFYLEEFYEPPNSTLQKFGIDTNTVLGGIFSGKNKEVLVGGKSGLGDVADSISAFILEAEPLSARGEKDSVIFDHPLEWDISKDNKTAQRFITDHSIVLPKTFDVALVLPSFLYTSVAKEIDELYMKKTLIRIITKAESYRNMVIKSVQQPLEVKRLSRLVYPIHFREIQCLYPDYKISKNGENQ